MLIQSLDNKKIKKYMELKTSKGRKIQQLFLVEGMHLCEEAWKKGYLYDVLLLENEELSFAYDKEITYVRENILKKMSMLTTPSNVIGVCKMIVKKEIKGNSILLLDDIGDPGNMGTIIRSAKAFNVDTIILSPNSVDIYNDKVLRSTQGMLFDINIMYANLEEVIPKLKKDGFIILGTDVKDGCDVRNTKYLKYALIMGNEGHGVSEKIKKLCDKNLYIKMNKNCESLNVGVATSILLYELDRGQNE